MMVYQKGRYGASLSLVPSSRHSGFGYRAGGGNGGGESSPRRVPTVGGGTRAAWGVSADGLDEAGGRGGARRKVGWGSGGGEEDGREQLVDEEAFAGGGGFASLFGSSAAIIGSKQGGSGSLEQGRLGRAPRAAPFSSSTYNHHLTSGKPGVRPQTAADRIEARINAISRRPSTSQLQEDATGSQQRDTTSSSFASSVLSKRGEAERKEWGKPPSRAPARGSSTRAPH